MTTTKAQEVTRRTQGTVRVTVAGYIEARLRQRALELDPPKGIADHAWPSAKYQQDPVAFFELILGIWLAPHQREIAEAVRDNKRVAVASGHKIGKTLLMAGLSLWFFCSFPDARAVMTSTTDRQVNKILWRELRKLLAFSGWCLACKRDDPTNYRRNIPRPCPHSALIDFIGDVPELARSGIRASDEREISGFTAREAEAVAGVSSQSLLYLVDEASGVPEQIFTAMRGNMMGGGRILMCSNPTRTEGTFFESFDKTKVNPQTGKPFYTTFQISSETVAKLGIPGCASQDEIEEAKIEYGGEDSPFYKVRIKGEFVLGEDGKVLSLQLITESQQRWDDTAAVGRLHIGVDPAGDSGYGDESAFAWRRGLKVKGLFCRRGLTAEGHLVEVLGIIATERRPDDEEPPVVTVDRDGLVGHKVYVMLANYLEEHKGAFVLVGVRGSIRRTRDVYRMYDSVRDELWGNIQTWMRAGGAIPSDAKLAGELHAPEGTPDDENKIKITPKRELREVLGRSPDRADAVCLCVWEKGIVEDVPPPANGAAGAMPEPDESRTIGLDPYAGVDHWRPSGRL